MYLTARNKKMCVREVPLSETLANRSKEIGILGMKNSELISIITRRKESEIESLEKAERLLSSVKDDITKLDKLSLNEYRTLGYTEKQMRSILASLELSLRNKFDIDYQSMIYSPEDVYAIMKKKILGLEEEHFWVLLLDTKNRVKDVLEISKGILDASLVHPREVYRMAIKNNTSSILLVHNHPSGDTKPSAQDISITKNLIDAGKILNVEMMDHIVVSEYGYTSLKEKRYI
jgi:DNA repair protein RadC